MKRTLLATVITAASFSSVAAEATPCDLFGENGFQGTCEVENGTVYLEGSKNFGEVILDSDGASATLGTKNEYVHVQKQGNTVVVNAVQDGNTYQSKSVSSEQGSVSVSKQEMNGDTQEYLKVVSKDGQELAVQKTTIKSENGDTVEHLAGANGSVEKTTNSVGETSYVVYDENGEVIEKMINPINPPVGVKPIEGEPEVKPTPQGTVLEAIADLGESGQNLTESGKAAAQQAAVQQNQIDELYALGNQNASDIDTLFKEVDRLDTRIDQTQALNAATVNARPMVTNGMTAFGAGVGYAGSEAALAIGVAHSFVDTGWSASGTLAASSDDAVVGAGVQYAF